MIGLEVVAWALVIVFLATVIILSLNLIFGYFKKLTTFAAGRLNLRTSLTELKPKSFKDYVLLALNILMTILLTAVAFGTAINSTILNPDLVLTQVQVLDVQGVIKELLASDAPYYQEQANAALDSAAQEIEPWLKEQAISLTKQSQEYFLRKRPNLDIAITFEPIRDSLRRNLRNNLINSPETKDYTPEEIQSYVDSIYIQAFGTVPSGFTLSTSTSSPGTVSLLKHIRQFVLWYQIAYWLLIALVLSIITVIVMVSSDFQVAMQVIGINLLSGGVLGYVYSFVVTEIVRMLTSVIELSSLQNWLIMVIGATIAAASTPGTIIFLTGIVTFALSFVVPFYWWLKQTKGEVYPSMSHE